MFGESNVLQHYWVGTFENKIKTIKLFKFSLSNENGFVKSMSSLIIFFNNHSIKMYSEIDTRYIRYIIPEMLLN